MKIKLFERLQKALDDIVNAQLLGISIQSVEVGKLILQLPYRKNIIGDKNVAVIDEAALTTLMDTVCAFSAATVHSDMAMTHSLDLRMDYIKSAVPGLDVIGEAKAYKLSHNVIFARGLAYHKGDRSNPIAHCCASFMRIDSKKMQTNGALV